MELEQKQVDMIAEPESEAQELERLERENAVMQHVLRMRASATASSEMPYFTIAEQQTRKFIKETFPARHELEKEGIVPQRRAFEELRLRITQDAANFVCAEWQKALYAMKIDEDEMYAEFVNSKKKSSKA